MAKTRRNYSGTSVSAITQAQMPSSSTTSFTVNAATNWPYGTEPFTIVIDPETASEEKLLVTRSNSTTDQLDIVQRGFDGTSAVLHAEGATTFPVFTALDADEANELTSMWESKGDIISYGTSTFARVPAGANGYVLTADDNQPSGLAWYENDVGGVISAALLNYPVLSAPVENWKIVASRPTGTINVNMSEGSVWYYTVDTNADFAVNVRGNGAVALDTLVNVGDAITVAVVFECGGTAHEPTTFKIDGATQTVLYLGDHSTSRNQATNVFAYTLVKTASATWTVLASVGSYK